VNGSVRSASWSAAIDPSSRLSPPPTGRLALPAAAGDFPAPADLIFAHAAALGISERTARHHVLHRDGLEAAAARPAMVAHYTGADTIMRAAVLGEAMVYWHPFVDGNKRTAWTAMAAFLHVEGAGELTATDREAVSLMVRLTMREVDAPALADWLRHHLRPASTPEPPPEPRG
jgi:death-on-curing family protein